MNAWVMPACRLLAPEVRTMLGIACTVLALLLLAVIADRFRAAAHLDRIGQGTCAAWSFGK